MKTILAIVGFLSLLGMVAVFSFCGGAATGVAAQITGDVVAEDGQMYHFYYDEKGKMKLKKGSWMQQSNGEEVEEKEKVDPAPGRKYHRTGDRLLVRADDNSNNWVVYKP